MLAIAVSTSFGLFDIDSRNTGFLDYLALGLGIVLAAIISLLGTIVSIRVRDHFERNNS